MKNLLKKFFNTSDVENHQGNNAPSESKQQKEMDDIYSADSPICNSELDLFNRKEFSERIAHTIATRKDNTSLVVGIYGKWGEGKTTVLNFINAELKRQENTETLFFNPWIFPSETDLFIAFYTELSKAIKKSLPTKQEVIGKNIEKYVGTIAGFFDKGDAVKRLTDIFNDVSLEELRDRIGDFLVEQDKLVVVLMDDVDRLDKTEIHSLFRLIKLSADLKNVVYIVAFDRDVVSAALNERYAGEEKNAGQSFLEKIVQVPISLPKIPTSELRKFCFTQIDKALKTNGFQVSETDVQEFTRGFINGVEIRLETPRMAIRYANILNFSLPLVKDEVHIVDFLLIEAIRAFYPDVYEIIKNNKDIFVATELGFDLAITGSAGLTSTKKEKIRKVVERVFDNLDTDEKNNIKNLIFLLFPRQKTVFENTHYGSEWGKIWAKEKRITSQKYFERYFTYSIPSGDVSDILIEEFIASLDEIHVDKLLETLNKNIDKENAESFIIKLNQKIERIPPQGKIKLAVSLSMFGDKFPNPTQLFSFYTPFSRASMLIARLTETLPSDADKLSLAVEIVNVAEPISFAFEIIKWFRTKKPEANKEAFSLDAQEKLSISFATRIEQTVGQDDIFFDKYPDYALYLISFWRKYGNRESADNYLHNFLNTDIQNVHKLLSSIVPIAYPMGAELPHKSDFERDQYDSLDTFVDLPMVYNLLKNTYGDKLDCKEYPYGNGKDVDMKIAQQFAWIYKAVQNEKEDRENPIALREN